VADSVRKVVVDQQIQNAVKMAKNALRQSSGHFNESM
jgi:hypothetical protein